MLKWFSQSLCEPPKVLQRSQISCLTINDSVPLYVLVYVSEIKLQNRMCVCVCGSFPNLYFELPPHQSYTCSCIRLHFCETIMTCTTDDCGIIENLLMPTSFPFQECAYKLTSSSDGRTFENMIFFNYFGRLTPS